MLRLSNRTVFCAEVRPGCYTNFRAVRADSPDKESFHLLPKMGFVKLLYRPMKQRLSSRGYGSGFLCAICQNTRQVFEAKSEISDFIKSRTPVGARLLNSFEKYLQGQPLASFVKSARQSRRIHETIL